MIPGLPLDEAVATFQSGQGDFIHLPEPAAEQLIADGTASLAVALGPANGHIAYSSFAATNIFLDRNPDLVDRFIKGYARALIWLRDSEPATVGEVVAPFFPRVTKGLIVRSVSRYKDQDTWPPDPHLKEPEFEGLQDILVAAGMVQQRQDYARVVRPEFAQAALA